MSGQYAFLGGIVDYAGLFPPARLPLDQALANYAGYLAQNEAWLLGRFVCPAARLAEVVPLVQGLAGARRGFDVAALGRGGADTAAYLTNVQADLVDIIRFHEALAGQVSVNAYEVRLPASAFDDGKALAGVLGATGELIDHAGLPPRAPLWPYFEAPLTDRASLLLLIQTLVNEGLLPMGFKMRTGGLEAAFPSCEQVAAVLTACAAGPEFVQFKATAGLHHPIRHFSAEVNATMHGFVNVFAAGCLALIHGLDEDRVRAIVADENPASFHVSYEGLRWRELTATPDELMEARSIFTSFGSCSFDEPRDDLRSLGWLPPAGDGEGQAP